MKDPSVLSELILRQAERHPERPAVVSDLGTLTYRELCDRAARTAHGLRERGVGPESVVGVVMRPSPELIVALLGVWLAGGSYVPLDPLHPAERVRRMVTLAGAEIVVSDETGSATAWPTGVVTYRLADLDPGSRPGVPPGGATDQNAAYTIFTSGSTGEPKGVIIEHRSIANRVRWGVRALGLTAGDRVLQRTPLTFDAAQWEIFAPLLCGAPTVLAGLEAGRDPAALLAIVRARRISVLQVVPSMLRLLVAESTFGDCESLRMLCCGGEPLPAELCQRVVAQLDIEVWNTYGPTECAIDVTAARFDRAQRSGLVPIGTPIDNNRCQVLPPSDPGTGPDGALELYAAGVGVGRGYRGDPRLTAERFVPDPTGPPGSRMYRTGDLVRTRADGGYDYAGRIDAQLKINGVRIEPAEVESTLLSHPDVTDAGVTVVTDPRNVRRLSACVVTASERTLADLPSFLRELLPLSMVPTALTAVPEIPRTSSGKIDRRRLPDPDWAARSEPGDAVRPAPGSQELVRDIWRQLLGIEEFGVDDDFFRLGGHSLLMTRLAPLLAEASGLQVELRDLYRSMTVRQQAALLDRAMRAEPIPVIPVGTRLPLSPAQERFWVLDRMNPGSPEYLLPIVVRLPTAVSERTLELALHHLVERHEVLRTRYTMDEDGLTAVVEPARPTPIRVVDTTPLGSRALLAAEFTRGFDLVNGPLWRAVLLRGARPDQQLLLIVCHHIIADGWSVGIIDREIREVVSALADGRAPRLPELPARYVDVVGWQRGQLTEDVRREQIDYWRRALAGMRPLAFPSRHPRQAQRSHRGAALAFELPAATVTALVEAGRREGASPFMTMLTLWTVALGQASGEWDFGVGTPHAGRGRPETRDLVGLLLNVLVIRPRIDPASTFTDALADVHRTCREAFAHHAVPFELVVAEVEPDRDLSRTPLFQTMFTLVNGLLGERPDDDDVALLRDAWSAARTDLTLTVWRHDDGRLGGALEYTVGLLDEDEVGRLVRRLVTLAAQFAADPDQPVGAAGSEDPASGPDMSAEEMSMTEETVVGIFSELLPRAQIGPHDDFFARGGNSLLAARLLWSIQRVFEVDVPMRTVFDHPTAAGIARVVEGLVRAELDAPLTGDGTQEREN